MRIKLAVLAALLLTPVLASCTSETEHATAVGRVSANLQAKVSADAGESGAYWFEYRQAGASTWIQTTHRNWSVGGDVDDLYLDEALRPSCGSASNCTQATLTSRTTYEYRFCGTVNGNGPVCQDSDSASDPPTTYDRFTTNWNTGLMEPFAGELAVDSAEDTEGGRALDVDGGSDGDAAGLANGANGMRRYPFNSDPSGRNGGVLLTGPFRKAVIHVYKQQESGSPNFGHYVAETIAGNLDNTLPMPPFGTSTTPAKQTHLPGPHQAVGLQNGGILITDLFHARVHYVTPPSQGRRIVTIAGTSGTCNQNVRWDLQSPSCRDNETPGAPPLSVALWGVEGIAPLTGSDGKTGTSNGGPGDFVIATRGGVFKITDLSYSYNSGSNSVTVSGGHLKRIAGSGIDNGGYVNDDPNGYDALAHNRDFAHVAVLPGGDYALLTGCRLKLLKNTTETVYGKSFVAGRLYPLAGEGGGSQPDSNGAGGCRDSSGVLPQDGDGGLATAAGIDGSVYFDVDYQGGIYLPSNASHRVRYISPPDPQTGERTIVSVAGSGDSRTDGGSFGGYGETVASRPALGPLSSTGSEPLLGFKSGVTLFNENGYSGLLWSDTFVFTGIERGRIMFTTLKDTFNAQGQPSASSLVVQPFPLIP